MNTLSKFISGAVIAVSIFGLALAPALAQTGSSTASSSPKTLGKSFENQRQRAVGQIEQRIASLTGLVSRIQEMKNISSGQKASSATTIQAIITDLNALKAKIIADISSSTLTADIKSVSQSFRVYLLVMPQVHIIASSDRALTAATLLGELGAKLESRLASVPNISDKAGLEAALADLKAKLIEAKKQLEAAKSAVISLVPDKGDDTKMQANMAALKDGRAKLKLANDALKAARKDAEKVIKALKKAKNPSNATSTPPTASSTSSTTGQ